MEAAPRRRLAGAGERIAGRWRRRQRVKMVLLVAVALVVTGGTLALYWTHGLQSLDLDTVDARFAVRGERSAPKNLVVVAIDDATFDSRADGGLGVRWQDWPRTFYARVFDNLRKDGARLVASDVEFLDKGRDQKADLALANAAYAFSPVIFSTTVTDKKGRAPLFGDPRNYALVHGRVGMTLFPNDSKGVIRRMAVSLNGLKLFAIVTAEAVQHKKISRLPGGQKLTWIDYVGPGGTIPAVSFSKVYYGPKDKRGFKPGTFRGKTVVMGPVTPDLQDVHPTSAGGGNMSGAEIQANAINTALSGFPLRSVREGWDVLAIVLLSILAPLASLGLSPLRGALITVVAGLAYLVVVQLLFDGGTVLTGFYPLFGLVLSEVGSLGVVYFTETRERRRLKTIFARFVPEAVVDQVIDQAEGDLRLGARRLESTVLFCDLRGFTSFAESLGEEIIDVLNHYLTEMSSAILDAGGTLVAYMGDGIMAVFGAPLEQLDHADRAVAAAKEMLGVRLPAFNSWLAENGMPSGFRMGIGLNTGQVMSGNVGSERRMEYTAVGDTTNTASRIEGMTKGTPHQLFIADATRQLLKTEADGLIEYGEVPVRGRQETIKLWALADEPGDDGGPETAEAASTAGSGVA
ncbi:MAG: adenylate cyclase [Solirubrobacteraceae bacterium]|jgi:adenylate cyclase|nr:adenylate cyclase [Solirubrobacteraceae bacterium]